MNSLILICLLIGSLKEVALLSPGHNMSWDSYHTAQEIDEYVNYLGDHYSSFVTVHLLGNSYEGRPIKVVQISSGIPNAKSMWIDGGIHAREWLTPAAVCLILRELIEYRNNYGPEVTTIDFYIVPQINPDGYEYSRNVDKMWRKNRRRVSPNCTGVDLNRNWEFHPELYNQTNNKCDDLYPGPHPFSEPETKAVGKFLNNTSFNMKGFLTFHTFGQMLMYPYGFQKEPPRDYQDLIRAGLNAVINVLKSGGPVYTTVNDFNHDGISRGGADDYAKAVLGIKYVYTVELRGDMKNLFFLPEHLIYPGSVDALVIALSIAKEIYNEI